MTSTETPAEKFTKMLDAIAEADGMDEFLTEPQASMVRRVVMNVPASAALHLLVGSSVHRPQIKIGAVVEQISTLGFHLGEALRAKAEVDAELAALKADIAATRRVLGIN